VLREVVPGRFSLESMPNDTVEQVREKERALAAMNARGSALKTWRRIADLWCASWFAPDQSVPGEAFSALSDRILTGGGALSPPVATKYLRAAEEISEAHRFFHWELEYPEVFFAGDGTRLANGGFDAVLGNPPWDMIRADTGSARDDPGRVLRFTRDAGIYTAQSDGHANSYQLFSERAVALTRAGGRVGLVLPAGLATDNGSASLRRLLLTRCDVDALIGFENRRGIFPIHHSIRFLLLTASPGRPTSSIACRFGVDDPADLESVGEDPATVTPWFSVRLPSPLLEELSGEDLTIPWFRAPIDLAIAQRAAALFPPLASERGWAARFGRELNATEDRQIFRDAGKGLPVVEGKQIEPFRVDLASSRWSIRERDALTRLRDGRHMRRRLAYRDVAGATNQRTLIAAMLPAGTVSTHTVFCLRTPLPSRDQCLLCGLFNSFVLNYLVRLRVSTHVTTALVERLPVPTREHAPRATREIAALARALSRRRDPVAAAHLQARVAALYQLTSDEFEYVLSTFPLVPQEIRDAAIAAYATAVERTQI
jgi:Eco57I restriction-modification methylase